MNARADFSPPADGTAPVQVVRTKGLNASQSQPCADAQERSHHAQRQPAAFRTLFTTEHRFDAGTAGFDYACEPGTDGGFAVHFDGRGSLPSIVMNGSDGQIEVVGLAAIQAFADAVLDAAKLARRQMGLS